MTLETFFEKFDLFTDAPDAVAKMRELVLQLAVQGKLIDQDPADEPANTLLERIKGIKDRLISERAIRQQNTEPLGEDEAPFLIPYSWVWTRLGEIGDWGSGSTPTRGNHELYGGGITWLKSGELNDNQALKGSEETVTELALKTCSFRLNQPGDVLLAMYGATIGKVAILAEPAATNQAVCGCTPFEGVSNHYLFTFLISQRLRFHAAGEGGAQPNISKVKIIGFPFPLPPLAEQKRIVAKVDELMALCDRLEAQQQERETRHAELARASLGRFADAPTPANLGLLFHKSYSIPPAELRSSILTLAVQGKLVPQDRNDEPALALLDRIAAHKAALSREGRLRGSTLVTPMAADQGDFELPSTWKWVRFGDIMVNRDGERIPVSKEERATKAKTYDYYGASGVIDKIDNYLFDKPLLLVGEDGANLINRSTPIAFIARGKYWVNNHAHVLDGISEDFLRFMELHINAIVLEPYITGTAQPKMNQAKMNSIPIALPPLAEQCRIVAKVDELTALVDLLETQLATASTTGSELVDAVVAELTQGRVSV
ncbi:MAG TPA: restriction endonuclease subunit S [Nitrospira sp.]|nr:restriction endonuclease subunit S [Nitrospira sp.]